MARNTLHSLVHSLLIAVLLLLPGWAMAAPCTDGTDCYEDCRNGSGCVAGSYRNAECTTKGIKCGTAANIKLIEDAENPDYSTNTTASSDSWVDAGGTGFRGLGSAWFDKYNPGAANCNFLDEQPPDGSTTVGVSCELESCQPTCVTCGPKEWRSDNLWQGNDSACIDIQTTGQQDDEQSGLTLNANYEGSYWLGGRAPAGVCNDIAGGKSFSGGSHIYFVAIIAYSSNLVTAGVHTGGSCAQSADFPTAPWKHFEFGPSVSPVFMGNFFPGTTPPFSPVVFRNQTGVSEAACDTYFSGRPTVGSVDCTSLVVSVNSDFDRSDDWPLATWALVRGDLDLALGTSNAVWRIWIWQEDAPSESLIFEMTGFDADTYFNDNSMSPVAVNWYFNGALPACAGAGACTSTQPIYIYYDMFEIGTGQAPPSAADVGWVTAIAQEPQPTKGGSRRGSFRQASIPVPDLLAGIAP